MTKNFRRIIRREFRDLFAMVAVILPIVSAVCFAAEAALAR